MLDIIKAITLLETLGKQQQREQLSQPRDRHFNLFRLLRPAHDEVHLHSRFLAELLNPAGTHGLGSIFLRLFAKRLQDVGVELPVDFEVEHTIVRREYQHIDVLLDDGWYWVIIENKLYAPDQLRQLVRYHRAAQRAGRVPFLYYLTLDGHAPADHSVQGLPDGIVPRLLSYADTIIEWLADCAQAAHGHPKLHYATQQYQQLLEQLTGQTMDNEKQTVIDLLEHEDYAVQAAALVRNWPHVRHHVEYQFWLELERLIANYYPVDSEAHFSSATIHAAIHRQRDRKTHYGIKFELGTLRQQPVLFKLDRGEAFLTYGLPAKSLLPATDDEIIAVRLAFQSPEQSFWLTHQEAATSLNFEAFSHEITLRLANPAARLLAATALWNEVTISVGSCVGCLQQVFGTDFTPHIIPAARQSIL